MLDAILELLRGLWTTTKYLFKRPVTQMYPEVKKVLPERHRWKHKLQRYDNGLEMCVGCGLCAAVCPSKVIYVVAGENSPDNTHSPGDRYAELYEMNYLRCIFCGFCVEACPTGALAMTGNYELANYDRSNFIMRKSDLLELPRDVSPEVKEQR